MQQPHAAKGDDTTLPAAVQSTGGNRKSPPEISKMNSPCDVQQLHTPVHRYAALVPPPGFTPVQAATRDESTLHKVAQLHRGDTKTPPAHDIIDSPGLPLQAHDTPVPPGDAGAQAMHSHDTLHAHDGVQLLNTTWNNDNSDPPIHSNGIVDPNFSQSDKNKNITDVSFPVVSSADYETDAKF